MTKSKPEDHVQGGRKRRNVEKTILIVDDEKINLELTAAIFRNRGFRVLLSTNAPDGLELVKKENPQIALLDYMMPGVDGFTALKEIKKTFPDTFVIMLTGRGSEQIAVELMKAGASDYVLKPFLNQDLVERVEKVLKVREMHIKNRELINERDRLICEIESWNRELEKRVKEKTRELQKVQQEIIQTEKMSTLGFLSAGMAHEIRNPLNSISLYVQLIKGDPDDTERLEFLDKIESEIKRIDAILRKLLDAVKRPHFHLEQVVIEKVIESSLDMLRPRIEMHGIVVTRDYRSIPPPIQADPSEIEQIFINLFVNSIEEMPHGGVLTVMMDQTDGMLLFRVSDTGRGVPRENLSRLFDPFFTTKVSGTGLGLTVVLRIVRTYHGKIEVESTEGTGTTFTITLPVPENSLRLNQ
jgi:signal transduction histidine kinase